MSSFQKRNAVKAVKPFCKVCHDAGKPESEYTSHFVKSAPSTDGVVVCPTLLSQQCGYCHTAGHTVSYCKLLKQPGRGKGDAVRTGFDAATGDILMILDADISVPPEELPRFYEALTTGSCEFANGSRMIYPMEDDAMQFLNIIGNRFFGIVFSFLLGQSVRDTLCGTKVLWRSDYVKIVSNRSHFGDFDPFGDFDLLFGAARLNLRIRDVPVHYLQRKYGSTNISRFRHGVLLLRMTLIAARKLRFT